MNDCILLADAINAAVDAVDEWDGGRNMERERIIREHLEQLPRFNRRNFGNWISDLTTIRCSKCGGEFSDEVMCCGIYGWPWMFCPKCGEKMEVSDDA